MVELNDHIFSFLLLLTLSNGSLSLMSWLVHVAEIGL